MRPTRPLPRVGMRVTVRHLAVNVPATVTEVAEEGRRVTVRTEEGETLAFSLNRTTAGFQAPEGGPRLDLRG